ncbi:DUF4956 domain-containing protein [Planctomycetota bacterium]
MENIVRALEAGSGVGPVPFDFTGVILSLLLAFVLGQLLAWVYFATHSGLSYSKSFVQSLIVITVVVAMVMSVIANSIITAVGLMGALAIVRFRNIIRDTRDIAFIFASLVIGMATGAHKYGTAIMGTVFISLIMVYLHYTDFGSHEPHNGFLRFTLKGPFDPNHAVMKTLSRFCNSYTLLSRQDTGFGDTVEYAYQLLVRSTARNESMLAELENVEGVESINLTMQEKLLEV